MLVSFLLGNPPPLPDWNLLNPRREQKPPDKQVQPIGQYRGNQGKLVLSTIAFHEPSVFVDSMDEFISSQKPRPSARKLAFLCAYNASPNVRNERGETMLTEALKRDHRPAIAYLLRQPGLNVNRANEDGQTPLILAALNRHWDVAKRLIDRGCDIQATDSLGKTVFDWLALQGEPRPLDSLLKRADEAISDTQRTQWMNRALRQAQRINRISNQSTLYKQNRLWNACVSGSLTELVTSYQAYPCLTDLRSAELSPLALSAGNGHLDQARLLLTLGAPIDQAGRSGITPLMLAAYCGREEMVQLLLRAGAGVERKNHQGRTALILAAQSGQAGAVEILLKANANPNEADRGTNTALSMAAQHGEIGVVQKLLDCPRLDLSSQGRNAARSAKKANYPEVSALILERLAIVENRKNCGYLRGAWLRFRDFSEG